MKADIFYTKENDNAIYTKKNITWRLPTAAITPMEDKYGVIAQGSVINAEGEKRAMLLGTLIITRPNDIVDDGDYVEFIYFRDSKFCESKFSIKSVHNIYKMMDLILSGRVSNEIPYENYMTLIKNSMNANEKLKVDYELIALALSTLFRNAKNPTIPAREKPDEDYIVVPASELPTLFGFFNSLAAEDTTRSLIIATSMSKSEQESKPSVFEKPMRM